MSELEYDEMVRMMAEGAARGKRVAEALAPVLAEILNLEEPYEISFSELTLLKTPEGGYRFMVNISTN